MIHFSVKSKKALMEDSLAVVLPKTGNHKKRLNNGGDLGAGG